MLGWITEREAREQGFRYKGWMFGVLPAYFAEIESDEPLIAMRWEPLEWAFDPIAWLWCVLYELFHDEPAMFGFRITREL